MNKLYIPEISDQIVLAEDWTFVLHPERRNEDHLFDQASELFHDGSDPEYLNGPNFEEEIWGLVWIPKYIGAID